MSKILSANKRTKLITTFGDVELHSVQEEGTTSNQVLKKAQEGIYRSAGVNTGLFASESVQALLTSLQRDESVV
jgi:peptide methionine sulfoxide reductase MsrB